MKVLHITAWWPSRVHPTHGNFIQKHVRLVAREHEVVVVAVQEDPTLAYGEQQCDEYREDGYQVVVMYYGRPAGTGQPANLWARARAYWKGIRSARQLIGKPNLIHGHIVVDGGIVSGLLSQLWRTPYVIAEHSTFYRKTVPISSTRRILAISACRRAVFIMPVTRYLSGRLRAHGMEGNYREISNVVDTDRFRPGRGWSGAEPLRFLHVSNFRDSHKNISGLLRAFAQISRLRPQQLTLHLAGDGDVHGVRDQIRQLGLENVCSVSGPHSEEEVAVLMQRAHAFVLFSNYETQGVVLMEALAAGLPCISTAVGGAVEVIHTGVNGLLVPVADEGALSEAIGELIDTYQHFDRGRIRQDAVAAYGEATILRKIDTIYRDTIDRQS